MKRFYRCENVPNETIDANKEHLFLMFNVSNPIIFWAKSKMKPMISINNYKVKVSSNNLIRKKGFDALKYIYILKELQYIYFKAPSEGGSPVRGSPTLYSVSVWLDD